MNAKTAVRHKHTPTRMCVVCRRKFDKSALNRVVMAAGGLVVDPKGKLPGRGAYLCDDPSCWERAAASDVLAKALKSQLDGADRDRLRTMKPDGA